MFSSEIFIKKINQLKQWGEQNILITFSTLTLNSGHRSGTLGWGRRHGKHPPPSNSSRKVELKNQETFCHHHSQEIKKNLLGVISLRSL